MTSIPKNSKPNMTYEEFRELNKGIRTLYDDIMDQIRLERNKKYFEQNEPNPNQKTFRLGDVCGDILDKIV